MEDEFNMRFSPKENYKIKQGDIRSIDKFIKDFALETQVFTVTTELKIQKLELIMKDFTKQPEY